MKTIQFPLEVRLHLSKFIAPGGFYEIKPTKSTKKFLISQTGRNFENRNSLLPGPGLSLIILYIIIKNLRITKIYAERRKNLKKPT